MFRMLLRGKHFIDFAENFHGAGGDTVYCVPTCSYFLENMKDCSFLFNIDIINFFAYNVA